jgi:AAA+ superfamily predicted ATPase
MDLVAMENDDRTAIEKEIRTGPDQDAFKELDTVVRSRNLIIQIVTMEEKRVINNLHKLAKLRGRNIIFWTCASGPFIIDGNGDRQPYQMKVGNKDFGDSRSITNPLAFLDFVMQHDDIPPPQRRVINKEGDTALVGGGVHYVLLDIGNFFPSTMGGGNMNAEERQITRKLKDIHSMLDESDRKTVILMGREAFLPEDIKKIVPIVEWPLPSQEVIVLELEKLVKEIEEHYKTVGQKKTFSEHELKEIAMSLAGLTIDEIYNVFRQSAVSNKDNPTLEAFIKYNINAKKDLIKKSRSGLEFLQSTENIKTSVGGLQELKRWLSKRANAYSEEAKEYGLENPKGVLLVGIPGNGKSLIAKAIANEWNVLPLRWDVGSVYSSRVGSSEANIRIALQTAEAAAPCVLFIDELEKAFAGIGSSDRSDAGTAARVFGTFIQWLSDKKAAVFVVATANRIDQLPAELIRKGRFDEIFYVDLPTEEEREEIIKIHLIKRGFDIKEFDIPALITNTENFTGAEIEHVIKDSMYAAFSDNLRKLTTEDIINEAEPLIPLAVTMEEDILALREWATEKARWASPQNSQTIALKKKLKSKKLKNKELSSLEMDTDGYTEKAEPDFGTGPVKGE